MKDMKSVQTELLIPTVLKQVVLFISISNNKIIKKAINPLKLNKNSALGDFCIRTSNEYCSVILNICEIVMSGNKMIRSKHSKSKYLKKQIGNFEFCSLPTSTFALDGG